jgi:trigger factor
MSATGSEAEAKEATQKEIQLDVEETGAVTRTIKVTVDPKKVRKAFDKTYKQLAKTASVRGFRKGKVPRSVLEKLYGDSIPEEIERLLISETYADAIELSGVLPLVEPEIEAERPKQDAGFEYTMRVEIKPEIALPEYDSLEATKPPVECTDVEVAEEIERMREQNAPLVEQPEDAQVAEGTTILFDYEGRIDGELFEGGAAEGAELEVGSGRFIPGFEEQLTGAKAGDSVTVEVDFPDDYGVETLNGKSAKFACTVHSLKRKEAAELDDEFARDMGEHETLDDLRAKVRADMLSSRERESDTTLHRTLLDSLIEKTDFEVPAGLVERQRHSQMENMRRQFQGQLPEDVIENQISRMHEEGRPAAERRVRESFLLQAVSAAESFGVEEGAVDQRFEEMAALQGMEVDVLKQMAAQQGWGDAIESELLDKKALDFLSSKATLSEPSESDESKSE